MATEAQKLAEDYGYQLAFLKSDKELYGIFQQAMKHDWDATRFVAAVKGSKWYKTHGEAYRTNLALKTTDPGTWNQRMNSQFHTIGNLAASMGAVLNSDQIRSMAEQSTLMGWNEDQLRDVLAHKIKPGSTTGEAGSIRQKLREAAYRNGFTPSEQSLDHWIKIVSEGGDTVESISQRYRDLYATRIAPGFEKELKAGMDLYDLATPYMQSMAQTLELNPSDVDLFDPAIRQALGTSGDKDGKPGSTPLWQFEQRLKQDPRYMKTKQAQDSTMAVGKKVLSDMGLVGS